VDSQRSEHKVVLPDEVWSETLIQATLEQTTASAVCEYVLRHYVTLSPEERPPVLITSGSGRQRSVYLEQEVWIALISCKVRERRPISAILEQQLRAYLGLELPPSGS
jgi:hypothetical protein